MIDYSALRIKLGRGGGYLKPGDTVRGIVTDLVEEPNPYEEGGIRVRLYFADRPKGIPLNLPLFDLIDALNIQAGDHIQITRGDNMPSVNGLPGRSTWTVERVEQPAQLPSTKASKGSRVVNW